MASTPSHAFPAGEPTTAAGPAFPDPARCNLDSCSKTATELLAPLNKCAKCRTTAYCSRDCQVADWPLHKRICGRLAAASSSPATIQQNFFNSTPEGLHNMGDAKAWLSSLPERLRYEAVSDAYRLRMEDREISTGSSTEYVLLFFMQFLKMAMDNGILPDECTPKDVLDMATNQTGDACIYHPMEKKDVPKRYGDPNVLEKLRMVAARVSGMPTEGQ